MGLLNRIRDPVSGIAQVVGCDPAPTAALGMPCRVQLVVQGAGVAPLRRGSIYGPCFLCSEDARCVLPSRNPHLSSQRDSLAEE